MTADPDVAAMLVHGGELALGAFHGIRDTDPGLPADEAAQRALAIARHLRAADAATSAVVGR
jgi:hypothetical protein